MLHEPAQREITRARGASGVLAAARHGNLDAVRMPADPSGIDGYVALVTPCGFPKGLAPGGGPGSRVLWRGGRESPPCRTS